MKHELPKLPYDYNALEPHIDEQTMKIHHGKHHQAYVDKLNQALEGHADLQEKPIQMLITHLGQVPESIRAAVRNNGGGHLNHSLFWTMLAKEGGEPSKELASAINEAFGSMDKFREAFSNAAMTRFGSGWAWLVANNGKLEIMSTANQDSPLTEGKYPLLAIDVWEHAYYLKYQNRRADYVKAFFNIINWAEVSRRYSQAMKRK